MKQDKMNWGSCGNNSLYLNVSLLLGQVNTHQVLIISRHGHDIFACLVSLRNGYIVAWRTKLRSFIVGIQDIHAHCGVAAKQETGRFI